MFLVEASYPLPFLNLQGRSPVPLIVFAIATHMMMHPDSDLLEVLGSTKSLSEAREGASLDYGDGPSGNNSSCVQ